jgi:hypothetical protein
MFATEQALKDYIRQAAEQTNNPEGVTSKLKD